MRRVIPLLSLCLLLFAPAEPVLAQQRLLALTPQEVVEVDTSVSSLGRVIRRVPAPTGVRLSSGPNPVPVAGGALLAWIADAKLVLFDTRSGSSQQYGLFLWSFGDILGTSADSYTVLVRASTSTTSAIAFIDVRHQTVRMLDLGANAGSVAYAPKYDLLFVQRLTNLTSQAEVRRAADGALLKTVSLAPAGPFLNLSVNASGTRLFVHAGGGGSRFLGFDVASGALLAHDPSYPSFWAAPILDEHRRRLLVPVGRSSRPFIAALSMDTLQLIGVAGLPEVTLPHPGSFNDLALQMNVSDRSATIFALETVSRSDGSRVACAPSTLVALQVDTGQVRKAVDLTAVTGTANCYVRLVRLTEPAAPSGFSASVTGRSVNLSWGAEAATHYEIEAGSASGLANLAILSVTDTHLTVEGVPPGVYYLRAHAINTIGKSGASREIQIIVP